MGRPAVFQRLRRIPAASISDNYSKAGYEVGTDAVELGTTDTILTMTGHAAEVGDVIVMTSGDEDGEARDVTAVTANTVTLSSALSGTPTATETCSIMRPVQLVDGTRAVEIVNYTNASINVSFDGVTDHVFIAASGSKWQFNEADGAVKLGNLRGATDALGTKGYIYMRTDGSGPTSSIVVISAYS